MKNLAPCKEDQMVKYTFQVQISALIYTRLTIQIPNFNTLRLGPLDGSPCDTLNLDNNPISRFWYEQDSTDHQEIQFRDVSYFRPEEWSWTFGDGNVSDEKNPLHSYATNGTYEVCLTVSNENSSNISCQQLQIGPVSNTNLERQYDL